MLVIASITGGQCGIGSNVWRTQARRRKRGFRGNYAGIKLLGFDADAIKGIMPFASKLIAQSGMIDSANWGSVELVPLDCSTDELSGTITYQVNLSYADGSSRTLGDIVLSRWTGHGRCIQYRWRCEHQLLYRQAILER